MTCWQRETWSLGVHHNVWKAGWDVGGLWWCWRSSSHSVLATFHPVLALCPSWAGCVFLSIWEDFKVNLPTAEQHLGVRAVLSSALQDVEIAIPGGKINGKGGGEWGGREWWGRGRRKWEGSRLRNAEAAQWPLNNPCGARKLRDVQVWCAQRGKQCDWPQLFQKKPKSPPQNYQKPTPNPQTEKNPNQVINQ